MSEWTKGPWRACREGNCGCCQVWSVPADTEVASGRFVTCVHVEWGDGPELIYGGVAPEEAKANARLIAATPELVEALELCLGDLEYEEPDGWMSGQVYGENYRKAKALLAKVKG